MKRPKPKLKTRSQAKPPTVRQVLGRLESRIIAAESAGKYTSTNLDHTATNLAELRQSINRKLEAIEEQDRNASKAIDASFATLRNQIDNLKYKFDGDGLQHRLNNLETGMHGLVLQAATKALVLLKQELERMGIKTP